jgi:hypothetical protein
MTDGNANTYSAQRSLWTSSCAALKYVNATYKHAHLCRVKQAHCNVLRAKRPRWLDYEVIYVTDALGLGDALNSLEYKIPHSPEGLS